MIRPILACQSPYETAKEFADAGWTIEFFQPPESGDPLAGVSLHGNSVLLGVTEGYVHESDIAHIGCGVEIYMTVPIEHIHQVFEQHRKHDPTELTVQPWGDLAFEVHLGGYRFMIAAQMPKHQ